MASWPAPSSLGASPLWEGLPSSYRDEAWEEEKKNGDRRTCPCVSPKLAFLLYRDSFIKPAA
jgi:hypothetical protein